LAARGYYYAGLPSSVRLASPQRCSPGEKWPIRASLRPLAIYIYVFGSQSCATRLIFAGSAPLAAAKQAAHGTLGSSARCSGARPLSRSLRRRSRRLHGDTRRNASSANTPPRLATCLAAHPTNRVAACRSVRHSPPRPLPHLPQGAFFFEASALADVSSARLPLPLFLSRCLPSPNDIGKV